MNPKAAIWRTIAAVAALGVMMAVWVVRRSPTPRPKAAVSSAPTAKPTKANAPRPVAHAPAGADVTAYRNYIEQLRAEGLDDTAIRRRVTDELRAHFRREQYLAELAFGQMLYPAHYWESSPDIETLFAVEKARIAELRKLDRELNGLLQGLFGADAELPPPRASLFSSEQLPPKTDFLPADSRERFERELIAADPNAKFSAAERIALAQKVLSPDEFALFVKWNASTSTALRSQLVEFRPTEAEYDAIFAWKETAASENGFSSDEAKRQAWEKLESALGSDRAAAFQRTEEASYQTAVSDLRQLGLPLNRVGDLLALKQQTTEAVDAIWRDPNIPADKKAAQVEQARQGFRQRLADMFHVPAALLPDEIL